MLTQNKYLTTQLQTLQQECQRLQKELEESRTAIRSKETALLDSSRRLQVAEDSAKKEKRVVDDILREYNVVSCYRFILQL